MVVPFGARGRELLFAAFFAVSRCLSPRPGDDLRDVLALIGAMPRRERPPSAEPDSVTPTRRPQPSDRRPQRSSWRPTARALEDASRLAALASERPTVVVWEGSDRAGSRVPPGHRDDSHGDRVPKLMVKKSVLMNSPIN